MSGFSAALKLGDLDDYLNPVNDCIVLPSSVPPQKSSLIKAKNPSEDSDPKPVVATITLSDCLACSGCVTTAETVLLQSHSCDHLKTALRESPPSTILVVSMSSASRVALGQYLGVSSKDVLTDVQSRLQAVLGFPSVCVLDTSLAEAIVVNETLLESQASSSLLLTSHCPGWTCYATKVLGEDILSHLSKVKSAEQIQGIVVKYFLPRFVRRLRRTGKVMHVLVSPCFDKKLEVIRPEYVTPDGQRAVDLVLASSELVDLISGVQQGDQIDRREHPSPVFSLFSTVAAVIGLRDSWAADEHHSHSGGYAQTVAQSRNPVVDWKTGKNKDWLSAGTNVLRAYGFRNIQNVAHAKSHKANFIEIMACPGGCPKGGGQPKADKPVAGDSWMDRSGVVKSLQNFFQSFLRPQPPSMVPDHICAAADYAPAKLLHGHMVGVIGPGFLRTEWKSIVEVDPLTGEKKLTAADLKW